MSYRIISKLVDFLPPEFLHFLFLNSLKLRFFKKKKRFENLQTNVCGMSLDNPVGLAAGFDKNAEAISGIFDLGFGFVELGTVTPMPQKGNAKPRVFKIPEFEAVIQRLGFNNLGIENFVRNLKKFKKKKNNFIGVNIGKNKNSFNSFEDYSLLYGIAKDYADYITINVSSPNTPGLRDLQKKENINELVKNLPSKKKKPTFVKISPDLEEKELDDICDIALENNKIDGLIVTNTTISRPLLTTRPIKNSWKVDEAGGLSGPPLRKLNNKIIKKVYSRTKGKLIIVGVGGISSGKDVFEKISLGCNLVQLYTSLIYQGPNLVLDILSELSYLLEKHKIENINNLIGTNIKL